MTTEETRLECLRLAVSMVDRLDQAPAVPDIADSLLEWVLGDDAQPVGRHIALCLHSLASLNRAPADADSYASAYEHRYWRTTPKDPPPGADSGGGSGG